LARYLWILSWWKTAEKLFSNASRQVKAHNDMMLAGAGTTGGSTQRKSVSGLSRATAQANNRPRAASAPTLKYIL